MPIVVHHHLKAIALFRGLRGLIVGSAGLAISGQTDQSLVKQLNRLLEKVDIAHPALELLHQVQMTSQAQLVQQLVVIALIWAMLLFVQAYGLWLNRRWAVWLALTTSVGVIAGLTWVTMPILGTLSSLSLAGNLLIALYLLHLLRRKHHIAK